VKRFQQRQHITGIIVSLDFMLYESRLKLTGFLNKPQGYLPIRIVGIVALNFKNSTIIFSELGPKTMELNTISRINQLHESVFMKLSTGSLLKFASQLMGGGGGGKSPPRGDLKLIFT